MQLRIGTLSAKAVDIWDEFTLEFSDHFNVELRGSDIAEAGAARFSWSRAKQT